MLLNFSQRFVEFIGLEIVKYYEAFKIPFKNIKGFYFTDFMALVYNCKSFVLNGLIFFIYFTF